MKITGVDYVAINVQDLRRAAHFYGTTLGLPFVKHWKGVPASEFQAGNLTLALMHSEDFGFEFHSNQAPIALAVESVKDARIMLESQGVRFQGETMDSGVCLQAFFEDSEGNVLSLHQKLLD